MSLRVVITPSAAADIVEARAWYDSQEAGVGDKFYFALRNRIHNALENPLLPRAWGRRKMRKYRIPKYPYSIFYEINAEALQVIAVVHGARNPKYLNYRLR
jgi:toxin ParE1/3/4